MPSLSATQCPLLTADYCNLACSEICKVTHCDREAHYIHTYTGYVNTETLLLTLNTNHTTCCSVTDLYIF